MSKKLSGSTVVSPALTDEDELPPFELTPEPQEEEIDIIAFRATEEGQKLVAYLRSQYTACKSAREREERQWKYNLAMYNGKQYLEYIRAGEFRGNLTQKPKPTNKERNTINRLESIIRTEMARLTSQKPSASVMPASADDEDMFAAMAGEQVWECQYRRRNFHQHFSDAAFWVSITGNGFIKTYWDDTAWDTEAEVNGDIIFESVSPFNLLVPDLRQTDIEQQSYVINVYTKTPEWLYMAYERELAGVDLQGKVDADNEIIEEGYLDLSSAQRPDPNKCVVYEFWIKPNMIPTCREGGHVVMVDDVLVSYVKGTPYKHNQFPFAHIGHIHTGKFYRRSVLNSLNELQIEYNSIRTQLNDARKKMAKPQLMAEKGSITGSRMTNETGVIIDVRQGFRFPTPLPLSEIPSYVMQLPNQILVDFEDISGQHQVSKGNVPPGVTAATAISYLQEKDDSYLVPTYQSVEMASEKIAKQTLSLAVQMWDVPRLIKIVGEEGSFDTMFLSGSDIESGTDIRIEPGSALPQSKAARQAFIMDLMDRQYVSPEEGLELLEIGGAQKLMDQLRNDKRQAQRENVRMKNLDDQQIQLHTMEWQMQAMAGGQQTIDPETDQSLEVPPVVTVNTYDNHKVHIEVHNRYRRSQAFEFLSPAIKAQFESHVEMHKTMLQQEQLQQMMGMIPTDGSVPGVSGLEEDQPGGGSGSGFDFSLMGMGAEEGLPQGEQVEDMPTSEEAVM